MKLHNVKVNLLLEAVTPITHMSGTSGNVALINRETIYHDTEIAHIPFLSGNALRHSMIREPGALYLLDALELRGKITAAQAFFLLNGGSLTKSGQPDKTRVIADMHKYFPLLYLLGGSLPGQIISGSLITGRGILICEENRNRVLSMFSGDELRSQIDSAESFITDYQYTRSNTAMRKDGIVESTDEKTESGLMIYSGQAVVPGAVFAKQDFLTDVSILEMGAYFHALEIWQNKGGVVGGMGRIGHGRVDYHIELADEHLNMVNDAIQAYTEHMKSNIAEAQAWLTSIIV